MKNKKIEKDCFLIIFFRRFSPKLKFRTVPDNQGRLAGLRLTTEC